MIALREAWKAGLFRREHWWPNLVSGVVVGVVALPLAMAFAIASGAKPEQGIYTAIIAGLVVSAFGGSRLQIAGPTGAFIIGDPFFFGAVENFERALIHTHTDPRVLILRLGRVPNVDITGLQTLEEVIQKLKRRESQSCCARPSHG